jgi:transmembrane secretion effector
MLHRLPDHPAVRQTIEEVSTELDYGARTLDSREADTPDSPVYLGNVNSADQIVISGSLNGMQKVSSATLQAGARKVERLDVRTRFSPGSSMLSGNLLIVLTYVLMAFVRQEEAVFVVAALAGMGWTLSASELSVAAQRAMPDWARGRLNATVIMISQGAMALGGVIWGSADSVAGASCTLIGAAVLFLTSLLLTGRLHIPNDLSSGDTTTGTK